MAGKIVVIAPTFNEEENISAFVEEVSKHNVDLLVSDSHSTDKTREIILKLQKNNKRLFFLDVKKRGLGLGLSEGLNYAIDKLGAETLVTMEADLSNDPTRLPDFIQKIKTADLVVGSRYATGGGVQNWSWWRKLLSRAANIILMILSLTFNIHEFTNLYRAFKKEVWLKIRPKVSVHTDWLFVPAFIFETLGTNFKIVEQPYIFVDRFGGRSKMKTMSYAKELLHYALRYRLQKSASFLKFCVVGGIGFFINTTGLLVGVHFGLTPANAGAIGAEAAILSNFILNNFWTFSDRKLTSFKEMLWKFLQFNLLSFGSVIIQYTCLKVGELIFGLARYKSSSWYMVFYVGGVGLGLIWNYIMYSKVIWRKKPTSA
ncbi:MAG: glycosyltransferase [Patescibacteria group bacterium]